MKIFVTSKVSGMNTPSAGEFILRLPFVIFNTRNVLVFPTATETN